MNYNFLFFRFFPTKRNVNSWKLDKEIRRSLMKLVERRREGSSIINETHRHGPKDLLGLMIQASNSSKDVTVHDIVEECKSFFFAGKQTTSNLLTWTTILLAMHPHWQVQAREEVLRVCGSRDIPTKDDVVKLKTVKPPSKTDRIHVLSVFTLLACFYRPQKKPFALLLFLGFFFLFLYPISDRRIQY
jgi:cytochrome P450